MRKDLARVLDALLEKQIPGLKSGFDVVDQLMRCFRPGELYTIGARPGGGKTAMMLKLLGSFTSQGHAGLYITSEMRTLEILQRIFAMATGVDHWKFREAKLSGEDHIRINGVAVGLSEYPMMLTHLARPSIATIRRSILAARPRVVFIDYLQRCSLPKAENMAYQIQEFYAQLKSMLLDLDVIGFIGAQSDRELDRNPGVRPMMAHLKGSGGIESESDGVAFIWEPGKDFLSKLEDFVPPRPGCVALELVVRKNRNGPNNVVGDIQLDGRVINILERKREDEPRQGDLSETYQS
jgi:replicative DNA helicase